MGGGFWTMSPAGFGSVATLWCVRTQINLEPRHTVYGYGLRPVISLNAELHATGNGTALNPYSIIVD